MNHPSTHTYTCNQADFNPDDALSEDDGIMYVNLEDTNTEDIVTDTFPSRYAQNLKKSLCFWYLKYNASKNAISGLLKVLSSHLDLPSCADTLLKDQIEEGMKADDNYHFFGVKDNICRRISAGLEHFVPKGEVYKEMYQEASKINKQLVTLSVNIDGISLFKSSSVTMWPITCRVNESNDQAPSVIGVYVGASKPSSLQDFLTPFVLEYLSFSSDDFFTPDGVPCRVKILNFICDAPARSLCERHQVLQWL